MSDTLEVEIQVVVSHTTCVLEKKKPKQNMGLPQEQSVFLTTELSLLLPNELAI